MTVITVVVLAGRKEQADAARGRYLWRRNH